MLYFNSGFHIINIIYIFNSIGCIDLLTRSGYIFYVQYIGLIDKKSTLEFVHIYIAHLISLWSIFIYRRVGNTLRYKQVCAVIQKSIGFMSNFLSKLVFGIRGEPGTDLVIDFVFTSIYLVFNLRLKLTKEAWKLKSNTLACYGNVKGRN